MFKIIDDIFIVGFGKPKIEQENAEYKRLTDIFSKKPFPREGYDYKLTTSYEWVEIEKPQTETPETTKLDLTVSDTLEMLNELGVNVDD